MRHRLLLTLVMLVGLALSGPGCQPTDRDTGESEREAQGTSEESGEASRADEAHAAEMRAQRSDSDDGGDRVGDPDDWCSGHGLPESMCTKCNPELTEQFKAEGDWCAAHGFPESACPQCNPMTPPGEQDGHAHAHHGHEASADDWCAGHALPESMCTKCNPELTEQFKSEGDWCAAHGFPESACPHCNPMDPPAETAGQGDGHGHGHADHGHDEHGHDEHAHEGAEHADGGGVDPMSVVPEGKADWCAGHGLPESKCTTCNPQLEAHYKAQGDWCPEHGYPESACPTCNPQVPPPSASPLSGQTVRFKADDHEDAVGIETVEAQKAAVHREISVTGRVEFDGDKVADVRSLVPGLVRDVKVELGATVERDDVLFVLESAAVGREQGDVSGARQRVATAKRNRDRQKKLFQSGVASARELEMAEQELASARANLSALRKSLSAAGAKAGADGNVVLTSPIAGTIVERPAVLGTLATGQTSLATVADTSTMWAMLDVPELEAVDVQVGQSVTVTIDGLEGRSFSGVVDWISPSVDPRTRTVPVRAELKNPRGALRANQFVRARIGLGGPHGLVVVPRDAIQRVGVESVVFVRTGRGEYVAQAVHTTPAGDGRVGIEGDVDVGDAVVTTGAFILKTELSPESIGAGCCEPAE